MPNGCFVYFLDISCCFILLISNSVRILNSNTLVAFKNASFSAKFQLFLFSIFHSKIQKWFFYKFRPPYAFGR